MISFWQIQLYSWWFIIMWNCTCSRVVTMKLQLQLKCEALTWVPLSRTWPHYKRSTMAVSTTVNNKLMRLYINLFVNWCTNWHGALFAMLSDHAKWYYGSSAHFCSSLKWSNPTLLHVLFHTVMNHPKIKLYLSDRNQFKGITAEELNNWFKILRWFVAMTGN